MAQVYRVACRFLNPPPISAHAETPLALWAILVDLVRQWCKQSHIEKAHAFAYAVPVLLMCVELLSWQ